MEDENAVGKEMSTTTGAFVESLQRNNKKIRQDRAEVIARNAHIMYKRKMEDLETDKFNLETERQNMLDLSPSTADSLVLATDFDAVAFAAKDLDIGVKIREVDIKLEIARNRFKQLFGEKA